MAGEEERLPLVHEEARVGRREQTTGLVRVRITPSEREETIPAELSEQEVCVERVPVGQFVDAAPPVRNEAGVTIIPLLEERAVVTVRLFLREELHVRTETRTRTVHRTVRLRSEEAAVERSSGGNASQSQGDSADE